MNYTECMEVADSLGDLNRVPTQAEAMILARRVMSDETQTVLSNIAEAIRLNAQRTLRRNRR